MITEQDVRACLDGRNEMTLVQLFPNIMHGDRRHRDAEDTHRGACCLWCEATIGPHGEKWRFDGVTAFSFRIIFESSDDAVMFKLAHQL